mmetsp:Transcript_12639/g.39009  ORF Transcript_12639/g.39009 Transcript_12639/m.39009 type:complete len:222 (+) Transcript_12639:240-905(+)
MHLVAVLRSRRAAGGVRCGRRPEQVAGGRAAPHDRAAEQGHVPAGHGVQLRLAGVADLGQPGVAAARASEVLVAARTGNRHPSPLPAREEPEAAAEAAALEEGSTSWGRQQGLHVHFGLGVTHRQGGGHVPQDAAAQDREHGGEHDGVPPAGDAGQAKHADGLARVRERAQSDADHEQCQQPLVAVQLVSAVHQGAEEEHCYEEEEVDRRSGTQHPDQEAA